MTTSNEPTRLVLIRHGRTAHTLAGLLSGRGSDPELCADGSTDAQAAADMLWGMENASHSLKSAIPSAVLHSPQKRAAATCRTVMQRAPEERRATLPTPIAEPDFCEIDFGDWEGLSYAQTEHDMRESGWFDSPQFSAPGGESLSDFHTRVQSALQRVLATHAGQTVWLFAHGGVIQDLLITASGQPYATPWTYAIDPGSISVIDFWQSPDATRIVTVNRR